MTTTIKTKHRKTTEDDIEICLRFEDTRGLIRYNRNSPEMVRQGIRRWIKKELKL